MDPNKKMIYDKVYAHLNADESTASKLIARHFRYALLDKAITDQEYDYYFKSGDDIALVMNNRHVLCLGDGIDSCAYNTTIECDVCKYNNTAFPGALDPGATKNRYK